MTGSESRTGFEEFVAARSPSLFRTAYLLSGGHRTDAEDLLQSALERVYSRWGRVSNYDDPEMYVRRALINGATDRWRLLRHRAEQALTRDIELAEADRTDEISARDALMQGLRALSAQQRAVLVLRYWEGLSEAETAHILGCSVGTVKSHASRAVARLRERAESGSRPGKVQHDIKR